MAELDDLLVADSDDESVYQKWFEGHQVALLSLGYLKSIPHPMIRTSAATYIPDFLVQQSNGAWRILELKTPQTAILRDLERRNTFYASFEHYVSQCQEYSEALDDRSSVAELEREYGIKVQKRPHSTIVAGRAESLDLEKLFTMTNRRTPPIEVCTFDDVLRALEVHRTFHFGAYDKAKGFSLYTTLMLHHADQKWVNNHLFDLGIQPDRNRIAIFVNAAAFLTLSVWDSSGIRHDARSTLPLSDEDYDVPRWFQFEVGVGDEFGFLGIQLEGKYQADIRINNFPFALSAEFVTGSDWKGEAWSWFSANEIAVFDHPLAFEEKLQMRRYAFERRAKIESGVSNAWVEFRGHKFLQTKGHPLAHTQATKP
jgi:antiviral defense system Shedu protein SduA